MSAASLFSSIRCVVVRGLENLPEESVEGLLAYAAAPVEDVALVLVHGGGQKGSGVLTKLRKLKPVTESKSGELKASEISGFVAAEVRSHGSTIDQEAAGFLVQAVGQDLRSLAAAADQLTNDFGQPLTVEKVKLYFGGARRSRSRRPTRRSGGAGGGARGAALGARRRYPRRAGDLGLRRRGPGVARYKGAPRGMRDADLKEVGVPRGSSARSGTSHAVGRMPGSRG